MRLSVAAKIALVSAGISVTGPTSPVPPRVRAASTISTLAAQEERRLAFGQQLLSRAARALQEEAVACLGHGPFHLWRQAVHTDIRAYTIKDGIVYDARKLLADVRRMVREAKDRDKKEIRQPAAPPK